MGASKPLPPMFPCLSLSYGDFAGIEREGPPRRFGHRSKDHSFDDWWSALHMMTANVARDIVQLLVQMEAQYRRQPPPCRTTGKVYHPPFTASPQFTSQRMTGMSARRFHGVQSLCCLSIAVELDDLTLPIRGQSISFLSQAPMLCTEWRGTRMQRFIPSSILSRHCEQSAGRS